MTTPPTSAPAEAVPEAVLETFALLAAGELSAFARLADDADHAPELRTRIVLSRMAAADLAPLDRVEQHVVALGADPEVLDDRIWEFRELLGDLDSRTRPRDWWERLVRTYIGYGVFTDLEREVSASLTGESAEVAREALADSGLADYVVASLRPIIDADPQLGARLALWARRVVGEALGIASRLLITRPALAAAAGVTLEGGAARTEQLTALQGRLTSEHARRMHRLSLTA